jgi:putative PIN family toxin of toxin-antitoxin system
MWRVVLDNAALTSAMLNPHGKSARLLDYAYQGKLRLFTSERMLTAEARVMKHKSLRACHALSERDLSQLMSDLPVLLCLVPGSTSRRRSVTGWKEAELMSCASQSRADFVVTTDPAALANARTIETQVVRVDQLVKLVDRGA